MSCEFSEIVHSLVSPFGSTKSRQRKSMSCFLVHARSSAHIKESTTDMLARGLGGKLPCFAQPIQSTFCNTVAHMSQARRQQGGGGAGGGDKHVARGEKEP